MKHNFINIAENYNKNFGLKIIPVFDKKPLIEWKQFNLKPQSLNDIHSINWNSGTNGIAVIQDGKYISLDFDKCKDEGFIYQIANELNINSWIVKTGNGFHIHLELNNLKELYQLIGKESGCYTLEPIKKDLLDHAEIRVINHYTVLPPSLHQSGKEYKFITGNPLDKPQKADAVLLLNTLKKYFVFQKQKATIKNNPGEFEILLNGVSEGQRTNALVKLFGIYFNQGFDKQFITKNLELWNKQNKPPIEETELSKQIKYLFNRYSKGLDGVFHQFQNCLLALNDSTELKLKKILCYSVIEFSSNSKIISNLNLTDKANEYHLECKKFINDYETRSQRKDMILRIGEKMILSVLNKQLEYYLFSVYCGIVSYLGRGNKAAKKISNDIISYRALGYKNELDFLMSETTEKPLSKYKIRKAVKELEKANFIRSFKLKRAEMTCYSTKIESKENLAAYVTKIKTNQIQKRIDEEELRKEKLIELEEKQKAYLNIVLENRKKESCLHLSHN